MGSIIEALERGATEHPDRTLYTFLDGYGRQLETYTYRSFDERTRGLASYLAREHGLKRQDRVLLMYPPGLELVAALCACARIGVIPAPIPPPRGSEGPDKLALAAKDCGATAVLTKREHSPFSAKRGVSPFSLPFIATDPVRGAAASDFRDDLHETLLLQYTSGSTTRPRGVRVSHDNVLHNCAGTLDFAPVGVSWLPQYHDMGLIGYYLFPMIVGGTTFGIAPLDFLKRPAVWLETITRVRATHTGAPNFGYEYCLQEDKLADDALDSLDLSSLRIMMNAAEPVRPRTHRRFLARFSRCGLREEALIAAYGLAENTIAVTQHGRRSISVDRKRLQRDELRIEDRRSGDGDLLELMSCGRPIAGVGVTIVDPASGCALDPGRIGEIRVTGGSVAAGYWSDPEAFGSTGELRTGDLGFFHEDELYVCGRIKDVIIVRGANYHPQDIEAVVESCSGKIRPGCTVAFGGGEHGERLIVAMEVKKAGDLPDPAAIARAIRAQCLVAPGAIAFLRHGVLPKTTSGKLSRSSAKRLWLEGRLPVIATHEPSGDHGSSADPASLRARFHHLLERHDIQGNEDTSFPNAGMDSLATVELLAGIKQVLVERGAQSMVEAVGVRLLERLTIAEFFAAIDRLDRGDDPEGTLLLSRLAHLAREQDRHEQERMRADATLSDGDLGTAVEASPEGRDLLLTGATGFFGPFLLEALLRETTQAIHVVVRAGTAGHSMQRIREALDRAALLTAARARGLEHRVHAVCGDLSRRELGLSKTDWARLAGTVGTIVHNGALVNYVQSYETLRPHNVDGTRELIRFASSVARKKLHFVSSTFIFGWTQKPLLLESDDNAAMENLDFGYAQSKWVAERLLLQAAGNGLDVTIYRPSLISASSRGIGSRDDIAIRLLAFMIEHGLAPEAENQISFLPADIAGHNIAALIAGSEPGFRTLHVTVDRYYSLVDVARRITEAYGYPFVYLPIPEFMAELNRRATRQDPIFPLLDFFNRAETKIAAMQHKRYASDGYRAARGRTGGRPDPDLPETVDYLMTFLLKEGLISVRTGTRPTAARAC